MMSNKFKWIFLISISFIFSSCTKEKEAIIGCKDIDANNYKDNAVENCCCEYDANIFVWMDWDVAWELFDKNVTKVEIFYEGKLIGGTTTLLQNCFVIPPVNCSDNKRIAFGKINIGNEKQKDINLTTKIHQNGTTEVFEGKYFVRANDCNYLEVLN